MLHREIIKLSPRKWLKMHLKLTRWGENNIHFHKQKTLPQKTLLHKELFSFNMSFNILQATQSWVQHVKADGNSHTRRMLK